MKILKTSNIEMRQYFDVQQIFGCEQLIG